MSNIYQKVQKLVKDKTGKDVTIDSNLRDSGLDSLDLLDFIVEAETQFDIKVDDTDLLRLSTVRDVVEAIENKFK